MWFSDTTDNAIKSITKAVARLERVRDRKRAQAEQEQVAANNARLRAEEAITEGARAERIRAKLQEIIQ